MDQLFKTKNSCSTTVYPIKAVYCIVDRHEDDAPIQIMASVSKRHFKRAVKRNHIKRQIREGYRLNKSLLPEISDNKQLLIAFIWITGDEFSSKKVHRSIVKLLTKIATDENIV